MTEIHRIVNSKNEIVAWAATKEVAVIIIAAIRKEYRDQAFYMQTVEVA